MTEELKPCPFCGGPAEHDHDDDGYCWVQCRNCGVSTDTATHGNTDARVKLSDMWNTRATLSPAHIEDGEEVEVEVVGYRSLDAQRGGGWFAHVYPLPDKYIEQGAIQEPLMTVAQHQRIVAARASKAAARVEDEREACERWIRQRSGMPAHIPMDWDVPFNRYTWAAWSARAALSAPPASEQQRAVVMPERGVSRNGCTNLKKGYGGGWNACLDELLRLNPHLAKGEGV